MDTNSYLKSVLSSQALETDGEELKNLCAERDRVKSILFAAFSDDPPSIRYAGSYAKGTLVKESYDLDLTSYFRRDSTIAGETLAEIWQSVIKVLSSDYVVQPKTSALRLVSNSQVYFHIDVVPGRFVDDSKSNVYLHQNNGTKQRLKTNLDVHVDFIKESDVVPSIRLLKLWKCRRVISVKQFVFELLVIDLLRSNESASLEEQLVAFWETVVDTPDPIVPEDPANPQGNDLSSLLTDVTWSELQTVSQTTLRQIENSGWEAVFGPVEASRTEVMHRERLHQAAAVITNPTRPWFSLE